MSCCIPNCQASKFEKISQHLFPDPKKEPERHLQWMRAVNIEKLYKFDPYVVFKRFRVCRNHFSKDSFNGQCKKLLGSAVPSLNLPCNSRSTKSKYLEYEAKIISLLKANNVEEDSLKLITLDEPSGEEFGKKYLLSESELEEKHDEDFLLMEVVNEDIPDSQSEFTIVLPTNELSQSKVISLQPSVVTKPLRILRKSPVKASSIRPLSKDTLTSLHAKFLKSPKNLIAQNICSQTDLLDVLNLKSPHLDDFNCKIDLNIPDSDHRTFWYQPAFITIRSDFIKQWNLEDFEFSQAHFLYWDVIERSYYFLNNIIETTNRGESVEGRLVSFILDNPISDGGQWDMIANIVSKHGLMPKKCFLENFSRESATCMYVILKPKLREQAKVLMDMMNAGASNNDVQTKVDEHMSEIYNITGICLGIPPEKFTWEYYDKNKKHFFVGPISPIEFYEQLVKPYYNVDDKVCLVTDPRTTAEFGKGYTVDCLGNVVGGRTVFYNNQHVDVLIDLVSNSIKNGEAVLFSCDYHALIRNQLENFKHICDEVEMKTKLKKSDRLLVRDASNKCFMILMGVDIDRFGKPTKFLVEPLLKIKNPFSISVDSDFSELVSDIVIDRRKFLSDTQNRAFSLDPIVLNRWDCLGDLCV